MKQKIVDKMKRVALTLFAALCIGSAWADVDIEIQQPLVIKSDGTLDIAYTIYYWDTGSTRYFDCKVTYNEEGSTQKTTVSMLANHAIKGISNSNQNTGAKYSDSYTLTGLDPSKTYVLSFKAEGMKVYGDKGSSSMGNNWKERTGIYTVILSGISSASATWKILPTKEFVVSGVQDTQLNVTKAKIRYEIGENLTAFSANAKEEIVNFADGKFEFTIPYANLTDDLLWSVWGQDANGNEYLYRDGNGVSLCLTERTEVSYATYTWTGAANNGKWTDVSNWTANNPGWGYPGLELGSTTGVADFNSQYLAFRSTVRFEGSAEVDLEGNRYEFLEQDDNESAVNTAFRGLEFSKPADLDKMSVVLKNGTIGTKIPEGYGPHLLGAAGVELEFRNTEFKIRTASNYLRPNAGATVVFSGDEGQTSGFKNQSWYFAPKSDKTNSRLVFRNFSGYTYYSEANTTIAPGSVVELVNAHWKVRAGTANTAAVSKGFAERVILRDGADRQAMIKCMYYANNDDQYANILLNNTYDIKIPAAGHTEASIWANNLTAASTCTFELDVSDYEASEKVPLVKLTSEPAFTLTANLVAKANGEDVTSARNAKLVWEGNTLYYQQGANEVVPGGDAVTVTAADETSALEMVNLKVTIPEGLTEDEKTAYRDAFAKIAENKGGNSWEVTAVLAETAKPVIGESAADAGDAFTVDAENVVITIQNYVKGLNYGVISADEVTKLKTEDAVVKKVMVTDGKITLEKSGDTKFYKVIVDFNEIKESPKAE